MRYSRRPRWGWVVVGGVLVLSACSPGTTQGPAQSPSSTVAGGTPSASAAEPSAGPSSATPTGPAPQHTSASPTPLHSSSGGSSAAPPAVATVTVRITRAAWDAGRSGITVAGIVPGAVEAGGTCTVTASRAGVDVTATGTGEPDASSTVCGELVLRDPRLGPGTWSVTLSYRSPQHEGSSTAVDVGVS